MTTVYEIGPFRLNPETRVLTRLGNPEDLGPRAVDVLSVLVRSARETVAKGTLITSAWPGLVVEEANLAVQISSIRRVLARVPGGERWLETLARRGYRFIGPVTELHDGLPRPTRRDRIANAPQPLTAFVGRERELVDLKRLLGKSRLLTLVGTGGIGKTRLAWQLGAEVTDAYRDGVWFIDLAALDDPELVPNVAAQALGVRHSAAGSVFEAVCRHVLGQRALFIFDNCEHVVNAAARLAEAILRGSTEPTIVATSRERLRIGGEQVYRLPPLTLPAGTADLDGIGRSDAVLLFVDRAQHQRHDFALTPCVAPYVAQLCLRLDGIPLALELAAALVDAYSLEEINARLDDRLNLLLDGARTAPQRQQTLRATLDWSHDLLSDAERQAFRRISVFVGSFTQDAAIAVAADEPNSDSTMADLLAYLVDRSLLSIEAAEHGARFRLLETTRTYGREKLDAAGETAAIRRLHARYFYNRLKNVADDWLRLSDADCHATYLPDVDDVRMALDWSLVHGDAVMAVGLAAASGPLWTSLWLYAEGTRRLEAATMHIGPGIPEVAQAQLWLWLGSLWELAAPAKALTSFESAIRLYRDLDDSLGLAHASARIAHVLTTLGRFESSAVALADARPALKRTNLPKLQGIYFANAGYLKLQTNDASTARRHLERAVSFYRTTASEFAVAASLNNLANVNWALGDLESAENAFREAVGMHRRSGHHGPRGFTLANLMGVLTERGKVAEALAVAREAVPLLGDSGDAWVFMHHLALRAVLAGRTLDAAQLAGYADHVYAVKECARQQNEERAHERLHTLLREQLDPAALERQFAEGTRMSEFDAMRIALEQ